jgi:transcriptional regulator with XRE-family HTH domain
VDHARLASDWLRAIRGRRSQRAFSRRLGYRSNIAYRWESGVCFPTAREVLAMCERFGLDVETAATAFLAPSRAQSMELALDRVEGLAAFLDAARGEATIVDLAKRAGHSRFAVSRWLKGEAEPRLPEFLAVLEAATFRALDFVSAFTDPAKLPSVADEWRALEAARNVAYDVPWSPAVLRVLELEDYTKQKRHRPGWIAERIGITEEEETRCLNALLAARQVRLERGRYVIDRTRTVDTRADPKRSRQVRAHWIDVARDRLTRGVTGTFGYNVMSLSVADLDRLRELHVAYFRDMQALVTDSPSECVVLFNTQLVRLDGGG